MAPDTAMIFAAGFGTRMGEVTNTTPKPMLTVAGRPMIDHAIDLLREAGVSKLVANTHHLPKKIIPHLEQSGVVVSHEPSILETGGGLRAALPLLGDGPVITMNPDAVWKGQNPVFELLNHWKPDMPALLMLVPLKNAGTLRENGDFGLENGTINRGGDCLYTGLQIIRTDRLHEVTKTAFSLNEYWDLLLSSGPVHGVLYGGNWLDIGHFAGLEQAERLLKNDFPAK